MMHLLSPYLYLIVIKKNVKALPKSIIEEHRAKEEIETIHFSSIQLNSLLRHKLSLEIKSYLIFVSNTYHSFVLS